MRRVMLLLVAVALAGCGASAEPDRAAVDPTRPNFVFVLTDDMRVDDLQYMPNTLQLVRDGMYFSNTFVADSRCCPSRATILTGQLPHNSRVYTNSPPRGGNKAFVKHGGVDRTFAVTLRNLGYRTALFGKYINGYGAGNGGVPPGWTDWAATARAYTGFDYTLNVNGTPRQFGEEPEDYMTDVLAAKGEEFIQQSVLDARPFFLKLSTFTPHLPAVAAPRHVGLVPKLRAPRGPAYNRAVADAPRWLAARSAISKTARDQIDARYRNRVRSLVSVDEMVGRIRAKLAQSGLAGNTFFVFSSDNGFHLGDHRLLPGKMTAFDVDIRVPLAIAGPGIPVGTTNDALVQNTDFAPTFEALAGAQANPGHDGRSLTGLLGGEPVPADWRPGALVEHLGEAKAKAKDPDDQSKAAGNPPTYFALRTPTGTYVEYRNGEREFYDHTTDPYELRNAYRTLAPEDKRSLSVALSALLTCDGAAQCATATPPVTRAARVVAPDRRSGRRR